MPAIRPTAVAGSFYSADSVELRAEVDDLLGSTVSAAIAPIPKALIAPHAGYIYSGPIAAAGYRRLAPARERIMRVVLFGPSHFVGFDGLAASSAEDWQTPLGTVPVDRPMVERLIKAKLIGVLDAAHAQEHSLEVHLPFPQVALDEFALVPIVSGDASPEAVVALLDAVWAGPETLIVVSTDLSHYLDYRSCQATDRQTAAAIERLDPGGLGPRPESLDAYGLVLRATRHGYMAMPDEAARAVPFLEQALALEPDYPAAHAMLAWCFHARFQRGGHSEADRTRAVRHAHVALKEGADDGHRNRHRGICRCL